MPALFKLINKSHSSGNNFNNQFSNECDLFFYNNDNGFSVANFLIFTETSYIEQDFGQKPLNLHLIREQIESNNRKF